MLQLCQLLIEGDVPVVVTRLVVAFPLVDVDYVSNFQLLSDFSGVPHGFGHLLHHN